MELNELKKGDRIELHPAMEYHYYTREEQQRFRPHPRTNRTARYHECTIALCDADIDRDDAVALRRIAMQLHRWHELECGVDNGGVERDEVTGKTYWYNAATGKRYRCADRKTDALKRLAMIMIRYPSLQAYVQGDPRGASLYVLRPDDVPKGKPACAYYNRGIAIYK